MFLAVMALSAAASYAKNKAENDAGMADAAAKRKLLNKAQHKAEVAYDINDGLIDTQEDLDNLSLDSAAKSAQSDLSVAMAGSGITGGVVDDMARQIELSVAEDRAQIERDTASAHLGNSRELDNTTDNIINQQQNLFKPKANFGLSDALGAASAGYSSDPKGFDTSISKYFKKKK